MPTTRFQPFVNVFVPFALIVTALNLDAGFGLLGGLAPPAQSNPSPNPTLARVVYTIWVTFLFAAPGLVLFGLYDLRTAPPIVFRYWQLFWGFGFLAYFLHSYYAMDVWFDWDFAQIIRRQTLLVTVMNFLLLGVWGVDVLIGVFGGQGSGGVLIQRFRWFTHILFAVMVYTAGIYFHSTFRSNTGLILAWVLVGTFGLSLVVRLIWGDTSRRCDDSPVPATAGTR